jgi:branched-chain amino acid transport system permease protein
MTFGFVLQVVVAGVAAGTIYGLVAIGFSVMYRMTSVLQFAHGDLLGAALFVAIVVANGTGPAAQTTASAWRVGGAYVVAVAFGAAAGAALYLGIVRPFFRRASALGWIGATVAVAFAIEGALAVVFPREAYVLADPFPFARMHPLGVGGGASIAPRTLWVLAVGIVLAVVAGWILARTRFGLAVSAVGDDPFAAQFAGLPVDALTATAFALAGALAAAGGVIGAPAAGAVGTQTGLALGLKGIAAALLARFGAPTRVFAAAVGLGVAEAAITNLHVPGFPRLALGPAWHDVGPLLLAVAVLALRPPRGAAEAVE